MKNMKSALTLLKILFFSLLLVANVVGFHYYFSPVAKDNLGYVPSQSKLVLTLNLKTISGKLFEEVIFHPDEFEEELITKDEKNLVLKNTTYGINPFGLVSLFVFPYHDKMVSGASLNLQNRQEFIDEMEQSGNEKQMVDGVLVFHNAKNTFFVFDKAAVILFDLFTESENESLAVEVLMNDEMEAYWNSESDFQLITRKGLMAKSTFAHYLRMIPDFMENSVMNGTFETGSIQMNGFFEMNKDFGIKEEKQLISEEISVQKKMPFYVHLSGKELSPYLNDFLRTKLNESIDSTGKLKGILEASFHSLNIGISGIKLEVDLVKLGTDLASGKWFHSSYEVQMKLISDKSSGSFQSIDKLDLITDSLSGGKLNLLLEQGQPELASAYLYWNPTLFLEQSEVNIFIRNIIAPFIIFDEFLLMLEEIKKNQAFYRGEISFKDQQVHSLIQLRLLFKNLSSMI